MTQGVGVMQLHRGSVKVFSIRKLIPRETKRSLRSQSFAAGLLVAFLMLIVTVSIVLLSSWLESFTQSGQ